MVFTADRGALVVTTSIFSLGVNNLTMMGEVLR